MVFLKILMIIFFQEKNPGINEKVQMIPWANRDQRMLTADKNSFYLIFRMSGGNPKRTVLLLVFTLTKSFIYVTDTMKTKVHARDFDTLAFANHIIIPHISFFLSCRHRQLS